MRIKICKSHKPYCEARVKRVGKPSLCCRYGWCGWAHPIVARKQKLTVRQWAVIILILFPIGIVLMISDISKHILGKYIDKIKGLLCSNG